MSIENRKNTNDLNKALSEEEIKLEIQRKLEFSHEKNLLLARIEKEKKLLFLKSSIERGLISVPTAEKLLDDRQMNSDEVRDILEKIKEIEQVEGVDSILPENYRITKEEYLLALEDTQKREEVVSRINNSLDYLYASETPFHAGIMEFFRSLIRSSGARQKKVIQIQGNLIDMKRDLENQ